MYLDLANILIFTAFAVLFIIGSLTVGRLIRPHHPYSDKLKTYECGEDTVGTSWIRFNVRFYIIALVFLIFDVEIAILFPWTTIFNKPGMGLVAFVEMLIFVGILVVGLAYVWVKGDLEWLKSLGEIEETSQEKRNEASAEGNLRETESQVPR